MWTRPSRGPKKFTKAPKSIDLHDLAVVDRADLGLGDDAADPVRAPPRSPCASAEAILIVPSSSMSILAPVFSTISRITLPPVPMTSRILSVGILHGLDARRVLAELGARRGQRLRHLAEDVHAAVACAWSSATAHDLLGDAGDLDVHLQRGDALLGAGDLEVHVAEVVLVAEDVGEHREALAFLDQAHGDAGDRAPSAARRRPSAPASRRRPTPSTTSRSTR